MKKFLCLALLPMLVFNAPVSTTAEQDLGENAVVSENVDSSEVTGNEIGEITECEGTYFDLYSNQEYRACATVRGEDCVVSTIFESSPNVAYEVKFTVNDIPEVNVDFNSDEFWSSIQSYGENNLDKATVISMDQDNQLEEIDDNAMLYSQNSQAYNSVSESDCVMDKLRSVYGNEYTNRGVKAKVYKNKSVFITDSMHFEKEVQARFTWQKGVSLATIVAAIALPGSGITAKAVRTILVGLGYLTAGDTLVTNVGTTNYRAMSFIYRDAKIDGKVYNSTSKVYSHQCVMIGSVLKWNDQPDIIYDAASQYYFEDCTKFVSDAYDMWEATH